MKKLLALVALAGGAYAMLTKRKQQAAAEAKLWDEATGRTTPAAKPSTEVPVGSAGTVSAGGTASPTVSSTSVPSEVPVTGGADAVSGGSVSGESASGEGASGAGSHGVAGSNGTPGA